MTSTPILLRGTDNPWAECEVAAMQYDDHVDVRRGESQSPEQFLWRGRLWQVREVMSRPGDRSEVWRVRAANRADGVPRAGVFDLAFDWVSGDWRLAGSIAQAAL